MSFNDPDELPNGGVARRPKERGNYAVDGCLKFDCIRRQHKGEDGCEGCIHFSNYFTYILDKMGLPTGKERRGRKGGKYEGC